MTQPGDPSLRGRHTTSPLHNFLFLKSTWTRRPLLIGFRRRQVCSLSDFLSSSAWDVSAQCLVATARRDASAWLQSAARNEMQCLIVHFNISTQIKDMIESH
jgi:hypothetical protein